MNLNCHLCTKPLHDQPQRGAFSCDFCGTKHKKGEFRLRCDDSKCDFDLDEACAKKFAGFNNTFTSQKSSCNTCKYPLINATYTKNTNWSCDKCKGKFEKYSQLRLRCEAHDFDICGGCNAQLQNTFNAPPQQQQGFNAAPQQQQGFNAPPQQQQGFNAPPQQQGFNAPPQQQGFNAPPQQQQQGFNAPPQQQQGFNAPPPQNPVITCYKCTNQHLTQDPNRGAFSCDFCGNKHKKGEFRLRCNTHDFDVCLTCSQKFHGFDQSYTQLKHSCGTCNGSLENATYSRNTNWSCDQCKKKFDKYTELRLRCEKHDYDLCGKCCQSKQQGFNAPPQQQQGFNAPPQQQGFNAPPQQQGFNAPPQQQGFNALPQQQGFNAPPPQNPVITCYKCPNLPLTQDPNRGAFSCDFCGNKHKKGDFRLRCNTHDYDVCLPCSQRFHGFNQTFVQIKHACGTCNSPLTNETYSRNTKWSCDKCKQKYEKYTQLRLRCDKHDYDLCGQCCQSMQNQFANMTIN